MKEWVHDSEASSSDTSCVFSLSYSATDVIQESMNSGGELEPYLYEPVASHTESSNDTPEDNEVLRTNERLLKQAGKETWPYS